jgi:hypothetical protein
MLRGISQLNKSNGIKVLVVLTDGEDNTSKSKYEDVIDLAVKEKIPIYIIGLGDVNKNTLNQISEATNGLFLYTRSSTTLPSIYTMIGQRVQAVYQVEYVSPNNNTDKNKRELNLSAALNNYTVVDDKQTYQLPETNIASVASAIPVTPRNKQNEIENNVVEKKSVAMIQKIPNSKIPHHTFSNNEKDTFWIWGNIILAGFVAAFILIYKRRKQVNV